MTSQADLTALWNQMEARAPVAGERRASGGAVPDIRGMADNDTVALRPGARGLSLRGQRGTFLVTQEGDPLDHVLEPGGELRTTRRGLVVIWALSDGVIAVGSAHP